VAETIIDTTNNIEVLQKCARKALDQILNNMSSSQIHKLRILSEEVIIKYLLFYFWFMTIANQFNLVETKRTTDSIQYLADRV